MELQAEKWDDPGTVALSEGENIALRRNRLGWKQRALAERAGVSLATVLKIEKDRNVRVDMLRAVEAALASAENQAERPTLSQPPATTDPSMKEGADAATLHEAHKKLEALIDIMAASVEDIRRTMARLDARPDTAKEKHRA